MDKIEYRAVIKFIVKEGFFESRGDCSCRGIFCRSYEEPLQGRDNGAGASLE